MKGCCLDLVGTGCDNIHKEYSSHVTSWLYFTQTYNQSCTESKYHLTVKDIH